MRGPAQSIFRLAAMLGLFAGAVGLPAGIVFSSAGCSPDNPLPADLLPDAERGSPGDCGEVTYRNFGADFFAKYCLRCHNEMLVGDIARTDAPTGINFNTLDDVRRFQSRIRLRAGVQGDMPPRIAPVPHPSDAERVQLIQWIDCGLPGGS